MVGILQDSAAMTIATLVSCLPVCVTAYAALEIMANARALPVVYIKGFVHGLKVDRNPEVDPRAVIKFRNNGANPLIIDEAYWMINGNRAQLATLPHDISMWNLSSATSLNCVHRSVPGNSCVELATMRPTDAFVQVQTWYENIKHVFEIHQVVIYLRYKSPAMFPCLSRTHLIQIPVR